MSNSVSSSYESSTVEAYRFQTSDDAIHIFIPSMHLDFSNEGHSQRMPEPYRSKKTYEALKEYREHDQVNLSGQPNDLQNQILEDLHKQNLAILARDEEENKEKIQVPRMLATDIDALVEKRLALKAEIKAIDKLIANQVKPFF